MRLYWIAPSPPSVQGMEPTHAKRISSKVAPPTSTRPVAQRPPPQTVGCRVVLEGVGLFDRQGHDVTSMRGSTSV